MLNSLFIELKSVPQIIRDYGIIKGIFFLTVIIIAFIIDMINNPIYCSAPEPEENWNKDTEVIIESRTKSDDANINVSSNRNTSTDVTINENANTYVTNNDDTDTNNTFNESINTDVTSSEGVNITLTSNQSIDTNQETSDVTFNSEVSNKRKAGESEEGELSERESTRRKLEENFENDIKPIDKGKGKYIELDDEESKKEKYEKYILEKEKFEKEAFYIDESEKSKSEKDELPEKSAEEEHEEWWWKYENERREYERAMRNPPRYADFEPKTDLDRDTLGESSIDAQRYVNPNTYNYTDENNNYESDNDSDETSCYSSLNGTETPRTYEKKVSLLQNDEIILAKQEIMKQEQERIKEEEAKVKAWKKRELEEQIKEYLKKNVKK